MINVKKIEIPEGYEFECIKDRKIILSDMAGLPKTYNDCFKYLGFIVSVGSSSNFVPDDGEPVEALCKLLICRNAWWKMDEHYRPDFNDHLIIKYTIKCYKNNIINSQTTIESCILAFRTEEIRNRFYKMFKDLIEQAKTLI
jgi:hypothetical protein